MGHKLWGCAPLGKGELGSHQCDNVAWTEAHLHVKCHLDPSSRLATIGICQKLGALPPSWGGGAGSPCNRVAWAEAYLYTKWRLNLSSHLATTDMGWAENWGVCPFGRVRWVPI